MNSTNKEPNRMTEIALRYIMLAITASRSVLVNDPEYIAAVGLPSPRAKES